VSSLRIVREGWLDEARARGVVIVYQDIIRRQVAAWSLVEYQMLGWSLEVVFIAVTV